MTAMEMLKTVESRASPSSIWFRGPFLAPVDEIHLHGADVGRWLKRGKQL